MKFIKDYFTKDLLREGLNELTRETFGFDFSKWYTDGYAGDYIPYSFEDNGKIVANASANEMIFLQNGVAKHFIQIGTVMTSKDYRNKGLARELIQRILEDYKDKVDGFFLFANLEALEFYEKNGFNKIVEYRYSLDSMVDKTSEDKYFIKGEQNDLPLITHYKESIKEAEVNYGFEQKNKYGLQMFYTANLSQTYYSKEMDCFISYELENDTLFLNSIISKNKISIFQVLERISDKYSRVVLGFTPTKEECSKFHVEAYDGGEDYRLHYIGEGFECVEYNKLFIPLYSHA